MINDLIPRYIPNETEITARDMNAIVAELRRLGQFSTHGRIQSSDAGDGRHINIPPPKKERKPIFAKITGGGTDALYEATEQKFNQSTMLFAVNVIKHFGLKYE